MANGTVVVVVATRTARKPPSKPSTKPKSKTAPDSKLKQASAAVWARHRADILAVGFILAGLVAACALWADVAGPFGTGLRVVLGALIGTARAAVPIMLVAIGIALLRGPQPEEANEGDSPRRSGAGPDSVVSRAELVLAVRLGIGTALTLLSVTGLLHIALGRPGISTLDPLMGAGGALGLVFGGTLVAIVGVWGASLVVGSFGLLGMVVLTRVSLRAWARRVDRDKLKAGLTQFLHMLTGTDPLPDTTQDQEQTPESDPSRNRWLWCPPPSPNPSRNRWLWCPPPSPNPNRSGVPRR